jgi:hypothetical protein
MSDKPLFQDADEQEATYAPQQLSPDDAASESVVAPATAGAFVAGDAAPGVSNEAAPVVGAAALAEETEDDDTAGQRGT